MPSRPPSHTRPKAGKKHDPNPRKAIEQAAARAASRKYATSDKPWRRIRAAHLAREPLCRVCANRGKLTEATEVDHINGDTWNNGSDNLQSLCKPCHSRKTAREMNAQRKTVTAIK